MRQGLWTAIIMTLAFNAWSEEEKKLDPKTIQNATLRSHLMQNIDVFGKGELTPIYILGPRDEEIDAQLLTRDFSRDEFFMQNIDREEFETKMTLRDINSEGDKKEKEKLVR